MTADVVQQHHISVENSLQLNQVLVSFICFFFKAGSENGEEHRWPETCHPSFGWISSMYLHRASKAPSSFGPVRKKFHTSPVEWQLGHKSRCSSSKKRFVLAFISALKNECRASGEGVVRPPLVSLPSLPPLLSDLTTRGEWERRSLWRTVPSFQYTLRLPLAEPAEECDSVHARLCVCVWSWQKETPAQRMCLDYEDRFTGRLMWLTCLLVCVLTWTKKNVWMCAFNLSAPEKHSTPYSST